MNSPMLPPVMSPKLSEAMTFLKLSAARCSMIAFALPSRSVFTTKLSSFTTAGSSPSATSTVTVRPGVTFTV